MRRHLFRRTKPASVTARNRLTRTMTEKKPQILVVLHQERSTSGKLGQLLQAKGFHLDKRRPRFGDPLPETMDDHAGAIIFGGPMSANDTDDFVFIANSMPVARAR